VDGCAKRAVYRWPKSGARAAGKSHAFSTGIRGDPLTSGQCLKQQFGQKIWFGYYYLLAISLL
jgi:hypothetical protein